MTQYPQPEDKNKIQINMNNKLNFLITRSAIRVFSVAMLLVLMISLGYMYFKNGKFTIAKASNSVAYQDGNVSIDKKYVDPSGQESATTQVARGGNVKVRVRYNNTASQSVINAHIGDTLPVGFSLVPGSIKNVYNGATSVSLPDDVINGLDLNTSPLAGYFGYSTTATTSNLELGRKIAIHETSCTAKDTNQSNWDVRASLIDTNGVDNSLTPQSVNSNRCGQLFGTFFGVSPAAEQRDIVFDTRGQRYIHQVTCSSVDTVYNNWSIYNHIIDINGINNSNSPQSVDNNRCGQLFGPYYVTNANEVRQDSVFDLLGQRYLHEITCTSIDPKNNNWPIRNGVITSVDTSSTAQNVDVSRCGTAFGQYYTNADSSFERRDLVSDLWDSTQSSGYIEYQMIAPNAPGIYGTNSIMSGSFNQSSLASTSTETITVANLQCDYIYPTSSQRDVVLGDAELRTDQDFTCNYHAQICVSVFLDANENGIRDNNEELTSGLTAQLKRKGDPTTISSLNTSNSPECFNPLRSGIVYEVQLTNSPSPYSTTGGFTNEVPITYESGDVNVSFGYSNGSLSLSAENSISMQPITVQSTAQNSCGVIHDIQTIDTRTDAPGYTVTATVDDFVNQTDGQYVLPVAHTFTATPQSITVVSGDTQTAPNPGTSKQVSSTTDPVTIMTAGQNSGVGTYKTNLNICLTVSPYIHVGTYRSTIYFTII